MKAKKEQKTEEAAKEAKTRECQELAMHKAQDLYCRCFYADVGGCKLFNYIVPTVRLVMHYSVYECMCVCRIHLSKIIY